MGPCFIIPSIYGYERIYTERAPLKYGKLATKYPWMYYGYFFRSVECNVVNVCWQETTEARELYRDEDAVHVFARFRHNTSDSVSCQALILQARPHSTLQLAVKPRSHCSVATSPLQSLTSQYDSYRRAALVIRIGLR